MRSKEPLISDDWRVNYQLELEFVNMFYGGWIECECCLWCGFFCVRCPDCPVHAEPY
jgi:hypothetical protein